MLTNADRRVHVIDKIAYWTSHFLQLLFPALVSHSVIKI